MLQIIAPWRLCFITGGLYLLVCLIYFTHQPPDTPPLWQSLVCSLWVCFFIFNVYFFLIPCVSEIIWYLSFSVWLISLSIIPANVFTNARFHFFLCGWVKLLFTFEKYSEMEMLDCMVVLFIIFWRNSILFSIVAASMYIPTSSEQGSCFSTSLPSLMVGILAGVRGHLVVVLICISLMISNVEHLSMCLWVTCVSSLEQCTFMSSANFWIQLFVVFLCWLVWIICVFWISTPHQIFYLQMINFSHSVGCLFILSIVFFAVLKIFS